MGVGPLEKNDAATGGVKKMENPWFLVVFNFLIFFGGFCFFGVKKMVPPLGFLLSWCFLVLSGAVWCFSAFSTGFGWVWSIFPFLTNRYSLFLKISLSNRIV